MFKVGDKVVCINNFGTALELNRLYEVYSTSGSNIALKERSGVYYPEDIFDIKDVKINQSAMTLPTDSAQRKEYPLMNGCLRYFPAALAGVALISKRGNDKHNLGQELHHDRNKSMDHGDCIIRHLIDVQDLLAKSEGIEASRILEEVSQMAWRALAYSQELHEKYGAPLAPGAKK